MSITTRDVARAAGVSVATVSRALNQSKTVTEATRNHVCRIADELGYVPNSVAKSLKTSQTQTIGFVVGDISNPDYISIAHAVEEIVRKENYNLILCSTGNKQQQELDYLQMLLSKNIDGLILNTTGLNNTFIKKMNERIPIVLLNRKLDSCKIRGDYIGTNSYLGSYQLTKHLLSLGHQRIYVVRGPDRLDNSRDRFQAFLDAMQEYGYSVGNDYPYVYSTEYTRVDGMNAVKHMLSFDPLPSAIISHSNLPMLGILDELHRTSLRIPQDISLAAYDALPNSHLMALRPTYSFCDTAAIGVQAAHSILEHIKNPSRSYHEYVFDPDIILGNAVAPPRV